MKLASFRHMNQIGVGLILDDSCVVDLRRVLPNAPHDMVALIEGGDTLIGTLRQEISKGFSSEAKLPLSSVELLAPIPKPHRNVLCVGRNYKEHVAEGDRAQKKPTELPAYPQFFTKLPATVIGPGSPIPSHADVTAQLDYEVELALVIGKTGRDIKPADALDHVFGVSIINDVSARDLQRRHGQWFKGKSLDGSCPFGPWIVHRSAWQLSQGMRIELRVNGELRQSSARIR